MKKSINEELKMFNSKVKDIDPYGEEDWDEYELKNNDIIYFFGIENYNPFVGYGLVELYSDGFYLSIEDCSINIPETLYFNKSVKQNLDSKQYDNNLSSINNNNTYIFNLVVDFKFNFYYKHINDNIRKRLFDNVKYIESEITNINQRFNSNEEKINNLKRNLKFKTDFPNPNDFELNENEYIVIKSINVENYLKEEIFLTKLVEINKDKKEKDKNKNEYNLIDVESGEKIIYLKDTYEKLIKDNYLLLKSKKNENQQTYISGDNEKYKIFINRIIEINNKTIEKTLSDIKVINDNILDKHDDFNTKLKNTRLILKNFNFKKLINLLDNMIKNE